MAFMRLAKSPVLLLVLLLSGCGGGPRPITEPPPAGPSPVQPRPTWQKPQSPSATPTVQGPQGPLVVARVGDYMDSLEMALRRHLRGVIVSRQGDRLAIVIPDTALFSSDGGVDGDDVLDPLAAVLRGYPHAFVQVNGYTDTTGTPDQNLAVSQKRARAIADALIRAGVAAQRLSAQGFGETHLRVATGEHRSEPRNRRIEIVIAARPG